MRHRTNSRTVDSHFQWLATALTARLNLLGDKCAIGRHGTLLPVDLFRCLTRTSQVAGYHWASSTFIRWDSLLVQRSNWQVVF